MKYKFTYQTTAFDIWQLSMYNIYGSMIGVCNIIFIVAMLLLTVKFWEDTNNVMKVLLIIGIGLFTIIQPTIIYFRAKKQASTLPEDMEIGFDDDGIHVITSNQTSFLKWNKIKAISKKATMIIILSTTQHGFVLTNKLLGKQKEAFYNYTTSKIQK